MIRVLIADDHPVVRSGLRAVLSADPGIDVIADVARAEDAVQAVRKAQQVGDGDGGIDVVTMDLRFVAGGPTTRGGTPEAGAAMSGVEATRAITALEGAPAVVVLTNYDDDALIVDAVEAGARGYLLKDSPPHVLTRAVHDAAAGHTVLAPTVQSALMTSVRHGHIELTPRERDVLECLDRGLSNREMGEELFLSLTTVKTHLARLYGKLGVSSRTAALAKARELGLLN